MNTHVNPTSWLAPAKINLFLHITARRSDGYHELQTLFQLLDVGDTLQFRVNSSGLIKRVSNINGVPEAGDIIVKAAKLLKNHTACAAGVEIHVDKILPMGGGLGGGSSDAATTLVALNHLWELNCSTQLLQELGLRLGADVPVFVAGYSAWAEGVGECLTAVEIPRQWYIIVTPGVEIATAALFNATQLTRDVPTIRIRDYFAALEAKNDSMNGFEGYKNVFEPLVRRQYPQVATALDWLSEASGQPARLSGTGASVFAAFENKHAALSVAKKIPESWRYFIAQGINESPIVAQSRL